MGYGQGLCCYEGEVYLLTRGYEEKTTLSLWRAEGEKSLALSLVVSFSLPEEGILSHLFSIDHNNLYLSGLNGFYQIPLDSPEEGQYRPFTWKNAALGAMSGKKQIGFSYFAGEIPSEGPWRKISSNELFFSGNPDLIEKGAYLFSEDKFFLYEEQEGYFLSRPFDAQDIAYTVKGTRSIYYLLRPEMQGFSDYDIYRMDESGFSLVRENACLFPWMTPNAIGFPELYSLEGEDGYLLFSTCFLLERAERLIDKIPAEGIYQYLYDIKADALYLVSVG